LRQTLAIATGKALLEILHRTGRGGTALPGLVAERVNPHILNALAARLPAGAIVVTGTNGKTTSTRLLATILEQARLKIVNNRSGSNLMRGLTSTLLDNVSFQGRPSADIGLFEVDEAAFAMAVAEIAPKIILVNNLFRDQLDRYGEIDTIRKRWIEAVKKLTPGTTLVLNADDPSVAYLARFAPSGVKAVFFGMADPTQQLGSLPHAVDATRCLICSHPLTYTAVYISHMGHYHCENCGYQRPEPTFIARQVKLVNMALKDKHGLLMLDTPTGSLELQLNLPGLYNAYNALGAATAALTLGLAPTNVQQGLAGFKAAFGRIEQVSLSADKQLVLALVKNPVGFNEVLRTLKGFAEDSDTQASAESEALTPPDQSTQIAPKKLCLLIVINDLIADGRDVSWLWDVDFEVLTGHVEWVITSGIRATDMAIRLKYAGIGPELISCEPDLAAAIKQATDKLEPGRTLFVTPTYTSMLQAREILQKQGLVLPFWAE
jgi:UDP-N-acetylmuramyl tripeptide synthase